MWLPCPRATPTTIHASLLEQTLCLTTCININNHYFCFFQEGDSPNKAARSVAVPQPCIIVRGTLETISTSFLVIEREIYCEIPPREAVLALLCAFYVYNIEYTPGCSNLFAFFESVFFKNTIKGTRRRLAILMAQLFPKTS